MSHLISKCSWWIWGSSVIPSIVNIKFCQLAKIFITLCWVGLRNPTAEGERLIKFQKMIKFQKELHTDCQEQNSVYDIEETQMSWQIGKETRKIKICCSPKKGLLLRSLSQQAKHTDWGTSLSYLQKLGIELL